MINMGNAATEMNVTLQYCMQLPIHLMESLEISSLTQVRASDDYQVNIIEDI